MKEIFKTLLSLPIKKSSDKEELIDCGFEKQYLNNKTLLCYNVFREARNGNIKAFETICKIIDKEDDIFNIF